jgi:hypothetical protein
MSVRNFVFAVVASLLLGACTYSSSPSDVPAQPHLIEGPHAYIDASKANGDFTPCVDAAQIMLKIVPSVTIQCASNTNGDAPFLTVHDLLCDATGCKVVGDVYVVKREAVK